jgi:phosphotransacetylase
MIPKAQAHAKRVAFPEGENENTLRAGHSLAEEEIAGRR